MTELENNIEKFLNKSFFFKDKNDEVHPFYKININLKFKLSLWIKENILGYKIVELSKDNLDLVFTKKNQDIIMSIRQRFSNENYKIIKIQKFKNKTLVKYSLVLTFNKQGIKTDIL